MSQLAKLDLGLTDPSVRFVKEEDIQEVINLFRLCYGNDYNYPAVYQPESHKHAIYNDDIVCLVIEEAGQIVSSGTIILDHGDHNDQIGEIARLLVHPEQRGRGLAKRLVNALVEASNKTVLFVYGDARTAHPISQELLGRAGLKVIGFMPEIYTSGETTESMAVYANLYGEGRELRRTATPQVIPEVVPLAQHSLSALGFPSAFEVITELKPYSGDEMLSMRGMTRRDYAALIKRAHANAPALFGRLSLDQGFSLVGREQVRYHVATNGSDEAVGAFGYHFNQPNRLVKAIELISSDDDTREKLCREFTRLAQSELKARVIEVDISAYDARLQRTFYDLGFRPVAYAPAMVFHNGERLDVVRMLKFDRLGLEGKSVLTPSVQSIATIVKNSFNC
jgi:RimJ/RimL family protein N-acetyltransferase